MATPDDLARDYLDRLSELGSRLRPADRDELVAQVRDHIASARADEGEDEAATRNVLDRLGTPEEIVAAGDDPWTAPQGRRTTTLPTPPARARRLRWQEIAALVLLPLGGFLFLVGWVVGAVLLWTSDRWSATEKVLGTLLWPFGYLPVAILAVIPAFGESCIDSSGGEMVCTSSGPPPWLGITLALVVALAPLCVLVLLAHRAAPRRG